MEVLYRIWKNEGEEAGRAAYRVCQSLPIQWVHESDGLLERAASIKATPEEFRARFGYLAGLK